jgi:hypothetical protein
MLTSIRVVAGGHVLVDQELVEHVRLIVEEEAAVGYAGSKGSSLKSPIASTGVCGPLEHP